MKTKVETKNALENYCSTIRHALDDQNIKDKIEQCDKDAIK